MKPKKLFSVLKGLTFMGAFVLSLPLYSLITWLYVCAVEPDGTPHLVLVKNFYECFPIFLRDRMTLGLSTLACSFLVVILSLVGISMADRVRVKIASTGAWRKINIFILVVGTVLFCINLWGLM